MIKRKKMYITLSIIGISLILFIILFFVFSIPKLETTYYLIDSKKVNSEIKLVVLSDLHSSSYGDNQEQLVEKIVAEQPDLILMTGDMIDESRSRTPCTILLNQLKGVAPMFFIHGNHEMYWNVKQDVTDYLTSFGVNVVFNTFIDVTVRGETIRIFGLQDPQDKIPPDTWLREIKNMSDMVDNKYTILLSHRPSFIEEYKKTNFDLVLCGHAHGGQWRAPWSEQGLYYSDEGLFPKYSSGSFSTGKGNMIVSRGLCKNAIPRLFNRPEILSITIAPQTMQ